MNRRCLNCMHVFQVPSESINENCVCPFCGFVENTPPQEAIYMPVGVVIKDRYVIGTVIGAGGFGITYRAWDQVLESVVCIKEYFPHGIAVRTTETTVSVYSSGNMSSFNNGKNRFLKEARSLAKFNSEVGTVSIHDFFEANGTAYIVMEYLEGCNMKEYMNSMNSPLSYDDLSNIALSVCHVLEKVHGIGLIHRDISPDNIFCCKNGVIKLIDFGAVKQVEGEEGLSATVILKHGFAPVEQYSKSGNIGPWTDIYSLAATLYKLATGVTPPESIDRLDTDRLEYPGRLNPQLPMRFCNALMKALSIQIGNRYQTVAEFRAALTNGPVDDSTDLTTTVTTDVYNNFAPINNNPVNMPNDNSGYSNTGYNNTSYNNSGFNNTGFNKGYDTTGNDSKNNGDDNNNKKLVLVVISILGACLIAAAVMIVILLGSSDDKSKKDGKTTVAATEEETTEKETDDKQTTEAETTEAETTETVTTEAETTEAETTEAAGSGSEEDLYTKFGIDSSDLEDYSNNLDPNEYLYYNSGIGEFFFKYPAHLFNSVSLSTDPEDGEFGDNIQKVTFEGSDGAVLIYTVQRRYDNMSVEEYTDKINTDEHNRYYNLSDILVKSDGDTGRIVVSGDYDSNQTKVVYDLIKIDDQYVYQMLSIKPSYKDEDERVQYAYVTETEYRTCGFSGSTYTPRSYEEFVDSGQY